MRKTVRSSAVVVLVAVMAACGGSSSDEALSKSEYIVKADAICAAGQKKIDAASQSVGKTPSLAQLQTIYKNDVSPALRDEITKLRALDPPKADEATLSKMLDDLSAGLDEVTTEIASAKNLKDLSALTQPERLKAAGTAAKAYGLTQCGGVG